MDGFRPGLRACREPFSSPGFRVILTVPNWRISGCLQNHCIPLEKPLKSGEIGSIFWKVWLSIYYSPAVVDHFSVDHFSCGITRGTSF
jgi:hypothetical protein